MWYAGRHLQVLWLHVKKLSARGRLSSASAFPSFILVPLHISVTNGARKLKFCTLVGIYAY